jgi:hypothetical protein
LFEEDDHVPLEEMENVNGLDCGEDGKPKGIREREQDKALRGHKISHFQTKVGLKKKKTFLRSVDCR